MDAVPIKFYTGINSYWKKRRYQKLQSSSTSSPKKAKKAARLGAGRPGWFLRLRRRINFRFKISLRSPVKLLAQVRDAYINCMLAMAGKTSSLSGPGPEIWSKRIPKARPVKTSSSEFERRLMFEIYKSLVVSGEI
ncbi:hypothetical protein Cni_G01740 [Canna indica]|uniref:Uncharacterized protein n=1 Tax=Canna indica TaxID=4628 RepID=A0AAQ3JPT5_9LILI|nr:hypothetical protein Cni_G01740 [Canna indica]